ncbi:MAG: DUF2784 domain-containing protein, partial [Pseudomonadota bacterium]|nr:DUF2784 domain-containing protein [Pseudomonadota bacterium]MBU0988717.1 DUF2784 domain-containing protein [Pseudomonadota bacterium]
MIQSVLAQITVILHFLWIVFIVFGVVFAIRRSRVAWLHLGGILFSLIINLFGWYCPLTYLEHYLQAGPVSGGAHEEPFIIHYLMPVIYPDVPERIIRIGEILFVCLNLVIYAGIAVKYLSRRNHPG